MKTRILLVSLSALLVIPNFIEKDINGEPVYNGVERFNPRLACLNSTDKLERYVDDNAALQQINIYSEKYMALLAYVISCRFYHGFSHYKLNENWIAAISEKLFGNGLASEVEPDMILQHPYAACSQQALVMMDILRRKNIHYRKVGFPHHYAIEIMINKNWYFFDPNMEPAISLEQRLHENWNGDNDSLKKFYVTANAAELDYRFGHGLKAQIGPVNEIPGRHAKLFQNCTGFLCKIAWCFPLFFVFIKKRRRAMYAVKPLNHFPRERNLTPVFSA